MDFYELIEKVNSKEKFIEFIYAMKKDKENNINDWENREIETYLDAVASWTESMEYYYMNTKKDIPQNIDWKFIATLFYVGKIYE